MASLLGATSSGAQVTDQEALAYQRASECAALSTVLTPMVKLDPGYWLELGVSPSRLELIYEVHSAEAIALGKGAFGFDQAQLDQDFRQRSQDYWAQFGFSEHASIDFNEPGVANDLVLEVERCAGDAEAAASAEHMSDMMDEWDN